MTRSTTQHMAKEGEATTHNSGMLPSSAVKSDAGKEVGSTPAILKVAMCMFSFI